MTKPFESVAPASPTGRSHLAVWAAYAACGWALLFAALSFFWAAGGRTGLHPLELEVVPGEPLWIINLVAGMFKIVIGLIALALVQSWGRVVPRKLLRASAWLLGVGMLLYGGLGLISDVLHLTGLVGDSTNGKWFFWYLVLWDPWWVLGGILYLIAAWFTRRRPLRMQTSDASHTEAGS